MKTSKSLNPVRNALPKEAATLSELAIRSKAYWGYDAEFMANCMAELTHSEVELTQADRLYRVVAIEETLVGFYVLFDIDKPQVILEALFVCPSAIGQGIGSLLFDDMLHQVNLRSGQSIIVQSDPNAEGFYLAKGMVITGKQESGSIPGRFLPTLTLKF